MNRYIPQLDWKAYFLRFEEVHGGERSPHPPYQVVNPPLQWKGWLLFPDGWRYSLSSHRGPERPPEDKCEAKELGVIYWKMRLASVSKEHRELRVALIGLEQSVRVYSAPLQQRFEQKVKAKNEFGDEITRSVPGSKELDLEDLRGRIKWLEDDIEQCERILEQLKADLLEQFASTERSDPQGVR